jgi:hypothetical protein
MIPPVGGTIHAMRGGGDGGAPSGYNPSLIMTPYVNPSSVHIPAYSGGGDLSTVAVGAVATKEVNNAARRVNDTVTGVDPVTNADLNANAGTVPNVNPVPIAQTISANEPVVIAVGAVATKESHNASMRTPSTKTKAPSSPATVQIDTPIEQPATDEPTEKKITLNGHTVTISKPWDYSEGSKANEALAWFGVDKAADEELKGEVLQALFDGVCDTNKPLIMVLECEPIRRLVQSLAEKLLGNLTRPVVKNTPAVIASKELQSATLMTFNVFKNQCKTKTAKEYIESSNADIVCTQKDTKTEFTNYTEIKVCGEGDDTARVYLKKGIPSAKNIECIVEGANSAVLFTYQGVIIANMGSNDPILLDAVLKKNPHIILGSVDDISSKGYAIADPIKAEQITTDGIWYKADPELFTLKDTIISNIVTKTDQPVDPSTCSYSDHNPITTVIKFNNTIKKLSNNADQAAIIAAKSAKTASEVGSRASEAIIKNTSLAGETSLSPKTSAEGAASEEGAASAEGAAASGNAAAELSANNTLEQSISFLEAEPTPSEYERIEKILTLDADEQSLKDQRNTYGSFYTRSTPTAAHTQYKTKNAHDMLEFVKAHLYQRSNGVIERIPDRYKQFKKDIMRANHLTFVSDTFTRAGKKDAISPEEYDRIYEIIVGLPDYVGQIISCFQQYMTESPIGIGMNENDSAITKLQTGEYPTLFMILPDKIVFHKVCVYQQNMTMNDPNDMKPSQFVTMFTLEIDPTTLIGSIQIDKYDIKGYVTEFEKAHAKNFGIVSGNAENNVLIAMLKRMAERFKNNKKNPIVDKLLSASIIVNKNMKSTRDNVSDSLINNVNKLGDIILDTTQEIISILETNIDRKATKLAEIQSMYKDERRGKLFQKLVVRYIAELTAELKDVSVNIFPVNEQWYNTPKISLPDVIGTIDTSPYEGSIQDAMTILKEQPDLHTYIYKQFMVGLKEREGYYESDYRTKSESNDNENKSLSVSLSDDKLSELLERLTESRAANAASMLPSITGYFKRRAIIGKIGERLQFHEAVRRQTISVSHTNAACAKASEYYVLFQKLVNEIGAYISNKNGVEYVANQIVVSQCDISDTDQIAPAVEHAENTIEKIEEKTEEGATIASADVTRIEVAIKAAVDEVAQEEIAVESIFDDELAKMIAVAAVAVLLQDFESEHENGVVEPAAEVVTVVANKAESEAETTAELEAAKATEAAAKATEVVEPAAELEAAKATEAAEPAAELEAVAEATAKAEAEAAYKEAEKAEAARTARTEEGSVIKYPPGPGELPPLNSSKKYISQHNSVKGSSYRDIIGKITKERWINKLRIDPVIDRAWKLLNRIDDVGFTLYDNMNRHPDSKKYESELIGYSKSIGENLGNYINTPISNIDLKNEARRPLVSAMDGTVMKVTSIQSELEDAKSNNVASSLPSSSVVSAPTSVAVTKPNALNTFVRANPLSKKRNLRTKNAPSLTNTKKIQLEMKTLSKLIDAKQGYLIDQFKLMKQTTRTKQLQDEIDNLMQKIDDRMTELNDIFMKDPNIHSETITTFIAECYSLLERINVLTNEIKLITETNGGKRRTQKKRKQKKRFGSQKKRV